MIPLAEINKFAKKYNVSSDVIEKDYIISWILCCLTKCSLVNDFVFYGGTAIKRIYFSDHRYSEDIDLISENKWSIDNILNELKVLEAAKDEANISLNIKEPENENISRDRKIIYVEYDGYPEITGPPKEIKIDFSLDRQIFGEIETQGILKTYSDLIDCSGQLRVMTLNTILANKFGMLQDRARNEPRDVYDIWFLLINRKKFKFDLDKIRHALKRKYNTIPSRRDIERELNRESLSTNWHNRLSHQIANLSPYDNVRDHILSALDQSALFID